MKKFALIVLTALLHMTPLSAQTSLRFQGADSYKENQIIESVKTSVKQSNTPYHIAKIDLNDDAINEYIVTPTDPTYCPKRPLCPHYIMAFKNRKPMEIGKFDAHKIQTSNKKRYGVNDLIIYNVSHNDYKQRIAHWNPFTARYILD